MSHKFVERERLGHVPMFDGFAEYIDSFNYCRICKLHKNNPIHIQSQN
jgi:hypothetical protein